MPRTNASRNSNTTTGTKFKRHNRNIRYTKDSLTDFCWIFLILWKIFRGGYFILFAVRLRIRDGLVYGLVHRIIVICNASPEIFHFSLNDKKFLATGKAQRRNWKLCGWTYNSWSFDMRKWGQIDRNKNLMSTTIYYNISHRWKDRIRKI